MTLITEKERKLRRLEIYIIVAVTLVAVMLSSWGNSLNIDRRGTVHALGIDTTENGYRVTAQIFRSGGSGSDTPVDVSQPNVETVSAEGETVSRALDEIELKIGRKIFLGHLQLICFGRDVDFSNPQELFQFAMKTSNVYLGVKICMGEGSAEEIMNAQLTRETTSAEALKNVMEQAVENGRAVDCEMIDFLSGSDCPEAIPMPIIRTEETDSGDTEVSVAGTAVIKNGRAVGNNLDSDSTAGVVWLRGEGKNTALTINHRGENLTVKLSKDSSRVRLENADGRLIYRVDITLVARTSLNLKTEGESEEISAEVEEKFGEICERAWRETVEESRADIFGIWKLLRHSYPRSYLNLVGNGTEVCEYTDVEVNVGVRVE